MRLHLFPNLPNSDLSLCPAPLHIVHAHVLLSRVADDEHDQIGSTSSTPPGAVTPRPDLIDKRLPQISHSYLGQVRESPQLHSHLLPPTPSALSQALLLSASSGRNTLTQQPSSGAGPIVQKVSSGDTGHKNLESHHLPSSTSSASISAASPTDSELAAMLGPSPPLLPHERLAVPRPNATADLDIVKSYPSPPLSASSSADVMDKSRSNGGSNSSFDLCLDARRQSVRPTTEKPGTPGLSTSRSSSGSNCYTVAAATPLSGVTASSLLATLMSQPLAKPVSRNPEPPADQHTLLARIDDGKLTSGGASPPRSQSTPPQTPRTRSQEETSTKVKAPSAPTAPPAQIAQIAPTRPPLTSVASSSSTRHVFTEGATIGPVLGKLTVDITEGRGLRPSHDPYVVCEFQLSQFISEGPQSDGSKSRRPSGQNEPTGISIRPAVGDGRAMAIPMRSRQSSSTGRDSRSQKEVTDPRWNHKALL
jgi:hypothetical protein